MEQKDITKRLSKSKINTFKQCPKRFYFSQTDPKPFVKHPAMERGTELHDIFENLYKDSLELKPDNFKDQLMKIPNSDKYLKEMNKFIEWQSQNNFMLPESCEEKIYDNELDIVIKWDRIDFDGKSRCLIDYKSGKLKKVSDFKSELMIYACIYMRNTKQRIDYVGIYFIDHGIFEYIPVTNEDMQQTILELDDIKCEMTDYQNINYWPEKSSYLCEWCDWKDNCSTYQRYKK